MFDSDCYDRRPLGDHEWPDEPDEADDDYTVDCPACGAEVYEDAEVCPVCGEFITTNTGPWAGRSPWWIAIGIAGIIATILALAL